MSIARPALRPHGADELAAMIRENIDGLRVRAAGTWMHAGHPVRASQELRLDAFAGVRRYAPGDLTISVGAATTLAELDAVTRAEGQWCPLLAWGDDAGSVGATLATATAGPCAEVLGRPRDLVLGVECVDGRGRVIRAGGRVVKNVAGFDLTRLVTGSWGTLAVITEVHLRLRARAAVDRTYYIEGASAEQLGEFTRGRFAPLAAVALGDSVAKTLGHNGHDAWLLRIAGNESFTAAALAELYTFGDCSEMPESAWNVVRRELAPATLATQWQWSPLAARVKHAFDPRDVLNPGLLGAAP
jgi:glycolate oxidase FAD binding subunit